MLCLIWAFVNGNIYSPDARKSFELQAHSEFYLSSVAMIPH